MLSILLHFRTQHCPLIGKVDLVIAEDECGEEVCGGTSVGESSVGETSCVKISVGESSVGETSCVKMSVGEMCVGETSGAKTAGVETAGGETSGWETSGAKVAGAGTPGGETACREPLVGMLSLCYQNSTSDSRQVVVYPSPLAYSTPRFVLPALLPPNVCSTASPSVQHPAPCSDLG